VLTLLMLLVLPLPTIQVAMANLVKESLLKG
jgi:hypothetical protein